MIDNISLKVPEGVNLIDIFGYLDVNLKKISEKFKVSITQRDGEIFISGKDLKNTKLLFEKLFSLNLEGRVLDEQAMDYLLMSFEEEDHSFGRDVICYSKKGEAIRAKTHSQRKYVKDIDDNTMVFGIGPAGTGKTFLAIAMAAKALKAKECEKIILARPAVEAGEKLGFLPGDLQEKVDPYLRPLYDALYVVLGRDKTLALKDKEIIQVVPLAYMRGRTLDNAFIILDEAQNTTDEQMKMFLTRLGIGSKAVITGDITQVDLPDGRKSGLSHVMKILRGIDDIKFVFFKEIDVVRHPLVRKIISAYEGKKR